MVVHNLNFLGFNLNLLSYPYTWRLVTSLVLLLPLSQSNFFSDTFPLAITIFPVFLFLQLEMPPRPLLFIYELPVSVSPGFHFDFLALVILIPSPYFLSSYGLNLFIELRGTE